jgi:ATP-dependent RNA helicase DeaD
MTIAMDSAFAALGVTPLIVSALDARGYTTPTAVQIALAAPELAHRDVMVSSQTGSGKTVAFGLLLAPRFETPAPHENGVCAPRAMVIAPTRELAAQVREELSWLLAPMRVRVLAVTGGTSVVGELRALARGADIVVGTPGRLNDHLTRGAIVGTRLESVVLDEADEMLDMGFRDELEAILDALPAERQTVMLSATLPDGILSLAQRYVRDPVRIASDPPGASNANIAWVAHLVPPAQRFDAVVNLLLAAPDERTLVFTRTRAEAGDMGASLAGLGFAAAALTGEMAQRERTQTLDAFRAGRITALIATDVAARGIDVPEVARVIHADLPGDGSTLTHRSGRTGRAGRKGTSVLLVPPFARGRAQQLLRAAGARAQFCAVPTRDEIRARAEERLRARVVGPDAADPIEAKKALAAVLLASDEATNVVARLLAEIAYEGPCAPRTITAPERKTHERVEREHATRGRFPREHAVRPPREHEARPPREHEARPPRENEAREESPRRDRERHVFFRVNFGERQGATPARLLAMVCRRGGVRGADVGSIRIGEAASTFGVSESVAKSFASAAARRDEREPHVRIEMDAAPRSATRPNTHRGGARSAWANIRRA